MTATVRRYDPFPRSPAPPLPHYPVCSTKRIALPVPSSADERRVHFQLLFLEGFPPFVDEPNHLVFLPFPDISHVLRRSLIACQTIRWSPIPPRCTGHVPRCTVTRGLLYFKPSFFFFGRQTHLDYYRNATSLLLFLQLVCTPNTFGPLYYPSLVALTTAHIHHRRRYSVALRSLPWAQRRPHRALGTWCHMQCKERNGYGKTTLMMPCVPTPYP